jgi:hypothetical protein
LYFCLVEGVFGSYGGCENDVTLPVAVGALVGHGSVGGGVVGWGEGLMPLPDEEPPCPPIDGLGVGAIAEVDGCVTPLAADGCEGAGVPCDASTVALLAGSF